MTLVTGGRRLLRLGGHMTTTMQQLGGGGSGGMPPQRITCSKIASEIIFGPKLVTALMRTSIVHTALIACGINWVKVSALLPGLPFLSSSFTLPILSPYESRLKTQTLAHFEIACWLAGVGLEKLTRPCT